MSSFVAGLLPASAKAYSGSARPPVSAQAAQFGCRPARNRSDEPGPKESFYLRVAVDQTDTMREVLGMAYGFAARVQKHRILYLAGRTRIHLDRVRGLGTFLELEVVLREDEQLADGEVEARQIMSLLAIDPSQLVELSSGDLLSQLREGDAASA